MSTATVAALCAGYGGLELGLGSVADIRTLWVAETDPDASKVLETRFPNADNLGDITRITAPPTVDIVTAGFPCQPVSTAGQRKGTEDERWLIDDVCRVARAAGASWLILENVRGILAANGGDAMAQVCAAMAREGFSRWEWGTVRASDVGAPHRRERWFCVAATDADRIAAGRHVRTDARPETEHAGRSTVDSYRPADGSAVVADSDGERLEERRVSGQWRQDVPNPARSGRFGPYQAAVHRWETILGRPAPDPLEGQRLNPVFVEWMMGLDAGWVTELDLPRNAQLRILGNGVVPQQAAAAIRELT